MHSIVIARYSEDLGWIARIPADFEIFVYNKGEPVLDPAVRAKAHHVIDRPNVGRESETYLHHMRTHRRADDDFCVFVQGDPFEHSPDFLALLAGWRDWGDVQPLAWQWKTSENVPPRGVLEDHRAAHPGTLRVRPERFSLSTWGPIDFVDIGAMQTGLDYRRLQDELPDGTHIASHFLALCGLQGLAETAARHSVGIFCYGAVFAVRNRRILTLPDHALEAMLRFNADADCYGYVLERLWLHIFGARFELPRSGALRLDIDQALPPSVAVDETSGISK